jgi:hypothetical protein
MADFMLGYLDAGTGGLLLAAVAGGIAGIGVLIKLYWNRFLGVFSRKRREQAEQARSRLLDR